MRDGSTRSGLAGEAFDQLAGQLFATLQPHGKDAKAPLLCRVSCLLSLPLNALSLFVPSVIIFTPWLQPVLVCSLHFHPVFSAVCVDGGVV